MQSGGTLEFRRLLKLAYSFDWDKIRAIFLTSQTHASKSMTITALLSPERIFVNATITSKKRLLEFIADRISEQFQVPQPTLFASLLDRERLGSTGLGKGFAVPHARLAGIDEAIGMFIKLEDPVNFEAPDKLPVDLVFVIVIPEQATDQHLQILSALARIFSQADICEAIRDAGSSDDLIKIIDSAEK